MIVCSGDLNMNKCGAHRLGFPDSILDIFVHGKSDQFPVGMMCEKLTVVVRENIAISHFFSRGAIVRSVNCMVSGGSSVQICRMRSRRFGVSFVNRQEEQCKTKSARARGASLLFVEDEKGVWMF